MNDPCLIDSAVLDTVVRPSSPESVEKGGAPSCAFGKQTIRGYNDDEGFHGER